MLIYFEKRKDIKNESSSADKQFLHGYYNIQLKTAINIKISRNMHFGFCLSCKKVTSAIIVEELILLLGHIVGITERIEEQKISCTPLSMQNMCPVPALVDVHGLWMSNDTLYNLILIPDNLYCELLTTHVDPKTQK